MFRRMNRQIQRHDRSAKFNYPFDFELVSAKYRLQQRRASPHAGS
jgi:hypothetical protein